MDMVRSGVKIFIAGSRNQLLAHIQCVEAAAVTGQMISSLPVVV